MGLLIASCLAPDVFQPLLSRRELADKIYKVSYELDCKNLLQADGHLYVEYSLNLMQPSCVVHNTRPRSVV